MVESDYYRSELLVHVAKNHELRGAARDAYTDVMNRIDSEYYGNTVAAALRSN